MSLSCSNTPLGTCEARHQIEAVETGGTTTFHLQLTPGAAVVPRPPAHLPAAASRCAAGRPAAALLLERRAVCSAPLALTAPRKPAGRQHLGYEHFEHSTVQLCFCHPRSAKSAVCASRCPAVPAEALQHTYLLGMCSRPHTDDTSEAVAGPGTCAAWRLAARSPVAVGQHWPARQLQAGSAGTAPGMPHRAQPRAAGPARRRSRIVLNLQIATVYSISVVRTRFRQVTALVPQCQVCKQRSRSSRTWRRMLPRCMLSSAMTSSGRRQPFSSDAGPKLEVRMCPGAEPPVAPAAAASLRDCRAAETCASAARRPACDRIMPHVSWHLGQQPYKAKTAGEKFVHMLACTPSKSQGQSGRQAVAGVYRSTRAGPRFPRRLELKHKVSSETSRD